MINRVSITELIDKDIHLRGFPDREPWAGQMPEPSIHLDPPTIRIIKNAKVSKATVYSLNGNAIYRGAIYDQQDEFIDEAAVLRGTKEDVFEVMPLDGNRSLHVDKFEPDCLFCGWNFGHFGHFLTETLPAAWAASLFPKDVVPILFNPLMIPFSNNEIKLLKASGIDPFKIRFVVNDVSISQLFVPSRMFRPRKFVSQDLSSVMRRVGQSIYREISKSRVEKIYISRRRLQSATRTVENESVIENFFVSRGFFAVHPERIPIEEQLQLFAGARIIAGIAGSFFHLAPLAASNALRIELSGPLINGNFVLTDAISEGQTVYINCLIPGKSGGNMTFVYDAFEPAVREFLV